MSDTIFITGLITGICLCSAVGFRIFLPFVILSIFSDIYGVPVFLAEGFISFTLFIVLMILSLLEIAGYYNPWIDNMLDLITTPLSLAAGIFMMSIFMDNVNPVIKWLISVIIGGGTSLNIHLMSVKGRALASTFRSGYGNTVFSTIELVSSIIVTIIAIYNPWLSVIFIIIIVYLIIKFAILNRKKGASVT
ncbi:MAG: hypothetical protein HGGPFJEG_01125 [Ignavibacteria bacterium]|nr:hypothetical protein [Ignavibacteria bacterium]